MATVEILTSSDWTECHACGVAYSSPVVRLRRKDGRNIWCPNGHAGCWTDTEAMRLRRELDAERQRTAVERQMRFDEEARRAKLECKLKRVERGVCPECNRSFANLARHMNCKHKESA